MRQSTMMAMTSLAALALAGCSANNNTSFRHVQIENNQPTALVVDAKQRMVLSAEVREPGDPAAIRRFCSEPSPDVFSVMAQALSAGGTFGQTADPASIEAAINLAFSSAEQGSTIPRTQTINMLREMMFRTCERYLSGGYDPVELSIQAARDQRIMVSILAIEQLTGVVAPRPVVLGATGTAAAGVTGEALVRLDDARKARDRAQAEFASASAAYTTANEDGICDTIEGKPEDELEDDQKEHFTPCNEARLAKTTAQGRATAAAAAYQELSGLARSGGVSAMTQIEASAQGGIDRVNVGAVRNVASVVQDIVNLNFNDTSETLMFCQRLLREKPAEMDPTVYATLAGECMNFMSSYVRSGAARLERVREELEAAQTSEVVRTDSSFDIFWEDNSEIFLNDDSELRTAFVGHLNENILGVISRNGRRAECFLEARNQEKARECLAALTETERLEIIEGNQ